MTQALADIKEKEIRPLLKRVIEIVRKHVPSTSYRVLLFGSWATLESRPTSDVDVGILGPARVDPLAMARIRDEVDRLPTLRKIQVVDLQGVEERFRASAERRAELLA